VRSQVFHQNGVSGCETNGESHAFLTADPLCACQLHVLSFLLAHQVSRIQSVHDKSLIYRDIKPDNFLIGVPGTKNANVIHLIGMSMALRFRFFLSSSDQRALVVRASALAYTLQLGKTCSGRLPAKKGVVNEPALSCVDTWWSPCAFYVLDKG
jgi:serine/threonine protein kinase